LKGIVLERQPQIVSVGPAIALSESVANYSGLFATSTIICEESFCLTTTTITMRQLLLLLFLATVCLNAVLGDNTNTVTIKNRLPYDVRYKVQYEMGQGVTWTTPTGTVGAESVGNATFQTFSSNFDENWATAIILQDIISQVASYRLILAGSGDEILDLALYSDGGFPFGCGQIDTSGLYFEICISSPGVGLCNPCPPTWK